jgi:hypothetical protein
MSDDPSSILRRQRKQYARRYNRGTAFVTDRVPNPEWMIDRIRVVRAKPPDPRCHGPLSAKDKTADSKSELPAERSFCSMLWAPPTVNSVTRCMMRAISPPQFPSANYRVGRFIERRRMTGDSVGEELLKKADVITCKSNPFAPAAILKSQSFGC